MRPNEVGCRAALAVLIAVVSIAAVARAAEPRAVVRNPAPQPLEAELVKLGKLVANAGAKLRSGAVGVGTVETVPAQRCCAANLKRMWVRFEEMEAILEEVGRCYETERAHSMVTQVEIAKVDLEGISQSADTFAKAATHSDASGALDSVTRAYLNFRRSAAGLGPCGDVAWRESTDAEEAESQSSRKSKKSRKKK